MKRHRSSAETLFPAGDCGGSGYLFFIVQRRSASGFRHLYTRPDGINWEDGGLFERPRLRRLQRCSAFSLHGPRSPPAGGAEQSIARRMNEQKARVRDLSPAFEGFPILRRLRDSHRAFV
jgi:hypothetical protein